ncbi:MAG TPA: low molecular weight protein-tyrosine-phosphatase [Longimicrobiales bacterium]|nr:low molecular weight protein-tyrosine-phosphatase [Longimicrobiales bacterium]
MRSDPISVLFVCLGNICRSPLAEGLFRALVEEHGLTDRFVIDSAGTSGYHDGEPPDARSREVARRRGVELEGASRRIDAADLEDFDYIVVMDSDNLAEVARLAERVRPATEVHLLRRWDPDAEGEPDVPDPYFGGPRGFEDVHDMVERSCRGLLDHIRAEHGL